MHTQFLDERVAAAPHRRHEKMRGTQLANQPRAKKFQSYKTYENVAKRKIVMP